MTQATEHVDPSEYADEDDDLPPGGAEANGEEIDESAPEGFQAKGGDLAGYWEPASQGSQKRPASNGSPAVVFTPLYVTLSDARLAPRKGEAHKSSTLIHCRLERRCKLRSADKGEGYKIFEKGTLFGIWSKPGMRLLANLANTVVYMKNNGFKALDGGRNDMVVFDIQWEKDGQKLKCHDDRRDKSLPAKLREARAQVADNLDDIPF